MASKSSYESLMNRMMADSPSSDFKREWMSSIASLWTSFGSKKFLGKKGGRILRKAMQDAYVVIEMNTEAILSMREEIQKLQESKDPMVQVKIQTFNTKIDAKMASNAELQVRYKFLSSLSALQELINGERFMKSVDKILRKKQNIEMFKAKTREGMESYRSLEKSLDSLEIYLEARKPAGSTYAPASSVVSNVTRSAENVRPRDSKDENDSDDEKVMFS